MPIKKKMKYIIPAVIAFIIIFGLKKKTPVYGSFIDGAGEGMKIAADIMPALTAMLAAAYMLRASGMMDILCSLLSPLTDKLGIPKDIMPLILLRPVSGSGSLGMLADILKNCGADSLSGQTASVVMGSTETTFYCICVYFSKTRVKYNAGIIPCALIGDIVGIIFGVLFVKSVNF